MLNFFFVGAKDGMECKKYRKQVFKLGVCGLRVYKENKFTKFDVSKN
jgi:hypothetical protein